MNNGTCTGAEICSKDGTCKGNHNEIIKMHLVIIHSNIIFVINPIYFLFIHEHTLQITLQQQSNPEKITNLAPGKLLLDNCMYELFYQGYMQEKIHTILFFNFRNSDFRDMCWHL